MVTDTFRGFSLPGTLSTGLRIESDVHCLSLCLRVEFTGLWLCGFGAFAGSVALVVCGFGGGFAGFVALVAYISAAFPSVAARHR